MTTTRPDSTPSQPLLTARGLSVVFSTRAGPVTAVDGVDLTLRHGQTIGVVGESGSGKSTLARALLRLVQPTAGELHLEGADLLTMGARELRRARRDMQMVFQNPYGSLLPTYTLAANVAEPLRLNRLGNREERRQRALHLLDQVGLGKRYADVYPRQVSGGQQQRVAIARALALSPRLLIADEPTSALDVSVQAQILLLLQRLQRELAFSMVIITHSIAVVERLADDIVVMRSGQVVEGAPTRQLLNDPQHSYTRGLLDAVLPVHPTGRHHERLPTERAQL